MGVVRGAVSARMRHIMVKRWLAPPRKKWKTQRHGSFTEGARVVDFEAPVRHDHVVKNSRLICPFGFCSPATCPPCFEGGRRWVQALNGEVGKRAAVDWGSGSASIPCAPDGWIG